MARITTRKRGIGLIAPSGRVLDEAALDRAIGYFKARGWHVVAPAAIRRIDTRFAGSDAQRLAALHAMAARDDVELVMAVRGGYGLSRLLHRIDFQLLAGAGKRFIGHSDFTALLCAGYAQGRMAGLAGPTAAYDFGAESVSTFTESHFWRAIERQADEVVVNAPSSRVGQFSGQLWGGNLALLAHLAGTPYLPRINGGLLFIEDINEHPFRVERMLYQLHNAGVLARQRALLLGDFSAYTLGESDNGYDFGTMVAHLRRLLPIPVLTGLPFGHVRDKLTLPFGGKATIDVEKRAYRLRF